MRAPHLALALAAAAPLAAAPGPRTLALRHGGHERLVEVHLPPGAAARPRALVLGLHGGGGSHASFRDKTGFVELAAREGFVVAFPEGTGRWARKLLTWNAGHCCGLARRQGVDDVGYLVEAVAAVAAVTPVDLDRVFVTGHSNGAFMAHRAVAERPDVFAAGAGLAGGIGGRVWRRGREHRVPLAAQPAGFLMLHAKDDGHVLFQGGQSQGLERWRIDLGVRRSFDHWRQADACGPEVTTALEEGGRVQRWVAEGCAAPVEALVAAEAGHGWWGASRRRRGQPAGLDVSASGLVWEFFSRAGRRRGR